jgi:hypothetical protein
MRPETLRRLREILRRHLGCRTARDQAALDGSMWTPGYLWYTGGDWSPSAHPVHTCEDEEATAIQATLDGHRRRVLTWARETGRLLDLSDDVVRVSLHTSPPAFDHDEIFGGGYEVPSFVCPACRSASSHPEDVRNGYCGHCHDFTGRPTPGLPPAPAGRRYLSCAEVERYLMGEDDSVLGIPSRINTTVPDDEPDLRDTWDSADEVCFSRRAQDPLPRHSPPRSW